jgi:hypothetical protein
MVISKHPATDAEDNPGVPPHNQFERRLVAVRDEPRQ